MENVSFVFENIIGFFFTLLSHNREKKYDFFL